MTDNAILLKRAMKTLGISGVALADMLSRYREDNRKTAPETISRWVRGTYPVEPAVIGWLSELLRTKALGRPEPIMEWPVKGSIMITVTNLKGGVGTTTVARNLAVLAAKDCNLKTTHICVGDQGMERPIQMALDQLGVRTISLELHEMLDYTPAPHEMVIVDLHCRAGNTGERRQQEFLEAFEPDIYVVPADFGSGMDVARTKAFVDIEGLRSPIRLLHRPTLMSMDFASVAARFGLDVESDLFYPSFIPQSVYHWSHIPPMPLSPWESPDQQLHHLHLLAYLIERVGGHLLEPAESTERIRKMDIEGLLDYLEKS